MNVDQQIYRIKNADTNFLKNIFDISLEKQYMNSSCRDFTEYSDNIKITRYNDKSTNLDNVKQISIKEDGDWIDLLKDDGSPVYPSRKFDIAAPFHYLRYIPEGCTEIVAEPVDDYRARQFLIDSLNNAQDDKGNGKYHESEVVTVDR